MASPAHAAVVAVHPALAQNPAAGPKKIVLLPPQVFVYELSAGGVPSRKTDWEATSRANLAAAVTRLAAARKLFDVVATPELDPVQRETLDAHMGLYERVASSVFVYGRSDADAWAHKKNQFDYTLGPGLAFLAETTGADAALVVLGADFISSGGRKAAFFAGLALGIIMPLGQSFVTAGVVDLKTGDVQWMSYDESIRQDTRAADDANDLIEALYATWPGQKK